MTVTKKMRFEVFKRDSFTCQYCGRSAPDVVLQADHIKPKAGGGEDDLLNLITSCFDCNSGKRDRELSDDTVVTKRLAQTKMLQERREQIEMMLEWHDSLKQQDNDLVDEVCNRLTDAMGGEFEPSEIGRKDVKRWLKKFELIDILEAIEISAQQYLKVGDDGRYTEASIQQFHNYIPRIIVGRKAEQDKPYMKDLYYIRGILRNRLSYCNQHQALTMLEDAHTGGASIEALKGIALRVRNWSSFKSELEALEQPL